MIKAEELRLGNLLHVESGNLNVVMEIKSKSTRCSYQREDTGLMHISVIDNEHLYGIPLTEEWLLDFGFSSDSYSNFFMSLSEYSNLVISFKDYACSQIRENVTIADHDIESPCKFVHQLQNLYFTLTGEELKIK